MDKKVKKRFIELYEMFPFGSVCENYLSPLEKDELKKLKENNYLNSSPVYDVISNFIWYICYIIRPVVCF